MENLGRKILEAVVQSDKEEGVAKQWNKVEGQSGECVQYDCYTDSLPEPTWKTCFFSVLKQQPTSVRKGNLVSLRGGVFSFMVSIKNIWKVFSDMYNHVF